MLNTEVVGTAMVAWVRHKHVANQTCNFLKGTPNILLPFWFPGKIQNIFHV